MKRYSFGVERGRRILWSLYSLLEKLHAVSDNYYSHPAIVSIKQDSDFVERLMGHD